MIFDKDLVEVEQACDLVEAAHRAQTELARFGQEKIDRICEAMVQAALREARRLGTMAVEETGYGVATDKEQKNRFAVQSVWNRFRDLRTVGVVFESEGVVELATPRGVVAGSLLSTNPTSTAILKPSSASSLAMRSCSRCVTRRCAAQTRRSGSCARQPSKRACRRTPFRA